MSDRFDALMEELEGRGLSKADADRIREATKASPIRKERDDAVAAQKAAEERAAKAEGRVRAGVFKELGIKVNPNALSVPETVDFENTESVKKWAGEMGLIEVAPAEGQQNTAPEVKNAIEAVQTASQGAGAPAVGEGALLQKLNELRTTPGAGFADLIALAKSAKK